jgi:hypothetical protein
MVSSEKKPGFRLPKDISHVSHNLLAIHLKGVKNPFGNPLSSSIKLTYFCKSTVGGVMRNQDGIIREVLA